MFTIMIVDDREIFRRKFKRYPAFHETGEFEIRYEAQNGKEALDILRREHVDILITDIRMPVMDGLELLKIVKEESLCPCVILHSEYSDFSYAKQGIVLGAFDYLLKPVDNEMLAELLKRCAGYIDSLTHYAGFGYNAMRILPKLVLKNDSYALEVAGQMVESAVGRNQENQARLCSELQNILDEIRKTVSDERGYMQKYISFDRLFSLNRTACTLQPQQTFVNSIRTIMTQLNKFSVNTSNDLILAVCSTIVRNIEDNLTLQSVAEMHFVNKAYLSHLFKQELGISFVDYLVTVKVERAKLLLMDGSVKVYEISSRLGYNDTEYFSRVFKQLTGVTPSEFRQQILEVEIRENEDTM